MHNFSTSSMPEKSSDWEISAGLILNDCDWRDKEWSLKTSNRSFLDIKTLVLSLSLVVSGFLPKFYLKNKQNGEIW